MAERSLRRRATGRVSAAVRAAELTNQLLGFSRRTMLHLEATNLNTAVTEAVRIVRRSFDPRIAVDIKPTVTERAIATIRLSDERAARSQ